MELISTLSGRCDYVDNGLAAIELVRESLLRCRNTSQISGYFTLILLDYSMPQINGPTTAQKILELYAEEHAISDYVPPLPHIVCLTAFTEKIFENKARDSGMNEFVSKPIKNSKLKQILRE